MFVSKTVLCELGMLMGLVGMLIYELIKSLCQDRDLYRKLWRQSDQRMSDELVELSPEAKELDLTEFNSRYNPSRLN